MKHPTKLTISFSKEARIRLGEMQLTLRANGCKDRETTPGKLVERLILQKDALNVLQKEFGLVE